MAMSWVEVEFLGSQPTILQGPTSRIRYTFVPQMRGMVDKRDVEVILTLERGGQRAGSFGKHLE